jgi:hypothetical protein
MKAAEKLKVWWTYDQAQIRWAVLGFFVIAWIVTVVLLFSDVVKVLATRPWWQDLVVAVATVAVPILAWRELRHSAEANRLRTEANEQSDRANELRAEANQLREKNAQLAIALDAERNKHLEQIAINTARAQEAAKLKIHPANRSRYILKRVGQGGAHGDFSGGYFEFRLRVENSGNRNSTVDSYKIWIQELGREFNGLGPTRVNDVQGRHCNHGVGVQDVLNEGNLIRIPPDDSTNTASMWFFLPELTLEMFADAGLRMQGPEHRFGMLHCRLTITDSNGISASGDFELSED